MYKPMSQRLKQNRAVTQTHTLHCESRSATWKPDSPFGVTEYGLPPLFPCWKLLIHQNMVGHLREKRERLVTIIWLLPYARGHGRVNPSYVIFPVAL